MFKTFRRLLAYFIDMVVVLIIVQAISSLPINKDMDKYTKAYDKYSDSFNTYSNFVIDLTEYYKDKKIDDDEYEDLIKNNLEFEDVVDIYYKNGKLSSKNYDKLVKEVDEEYTKVYKVDYYKVDKYSRLFNGDYFIVIVLYFVGFNVITNGATLGKKLARLRIVNSKERNDKVSILSYVIRCIMVYQPLYYLFKTIFVSILDVSIYSDVSSVIYNIHLYLLVVIVTFIVVRLDGKGLHDILVGTEVVSVNKSLKNME